MRLFEAAARYRPTASFRSYLLTITTRLCLNRRAHFGYLREHPTDASVLDEIQAGGAPDPEDDLIEQERRMDIRAAIGALPDEQRMAIILFRFEGLSYSEIAAVMGKSVSAVTSLMWRANGRLRVALQHLLDDDDEEARKDPPRHRLDKAGAKDP